MESILDACKWKWELYEPYPESKDFKSMIEIIEEDKHCCFFG
jgi:hypothetical protein